MTAGRGLRGSMSRRTNPCDHAQCGSVIEKVKCEEVYSNDYGTLLDVASRLPRFLDRLYDEERLHSALGYLSPLGIVIQGLHRNMCRIVLGPAGA